MGHRDSFLRKEWLRGYDFQGGNRASYSTSKEKNQGSYSRSKEKIRGGCQSFFGKNLLSTIVKEREHLVRHTHSSWVCSGRRVLGPA